MIKTKQIACQVYKDLDQQDIQKDKKYTSRSLRLFVFQLVQLSLSDLLCGQPLIRSLQQNCFCNYIKCFVLFTSYLPTSNIIFNIQRRERYSKEKCHFQPFVEADDEEEDRDEEDNAKDGDEVRGNRTLLL